MRLSFLLLLMCNMIWTHPASAQKEAINASNYMSYINHPHLKGGNIYTDWLRKDDILPVIKEELRSSKLGYVREDVVYQLRDGRVLLLDFYIKEIDMGIVFRGTHSVPIDLSIRKYLYGQYDKGFTLYRDLVLQGGEIQRLQFTDLPPNIFIIYEDFYPFQKTNRESDLPYLVTKDIITQILVEDIQYCIQKMKK